MPCPRAGRELGVPTATLGPGANQAEVRSDLPDFGGRLSFPGFTPTTSPKIAGHPGGWDR